MNKNIESIYPLSPMQEGLLFHTLYAPDSGVYFEQLSCTLYGNLNITAFERAWQRVVERHPVLRTLFIWEHRKKPLQVVRKSVNLPWVQHDWRGLTPTEQQERLEAFLHADREQGFELDQAPLMRCALIQVREDTYQFVWSHHHLLMDGWCLSIILKEVFAFYESFKQSQDLYLDARRPYRDYIVWLQQQDLSQAETFWRQALQGFSAPTPLVVDRAVDSLSNRKEIYDEQHIQLSAAVTAALQSLARQHHLTLNTVVQGAWAVLLSRYSGEEDVVFGYTVSGRSHALPGVESMVGLFINTLPVRVQVSKEASVLPWLQQLQTDHVEREQYSYSPLVGIQGWSDVPRGLPLFESLVVFENYPVDASLQEPSGSLEIGNVHFVEQTNYPLTVEAAPGSELSLGISYDVCRFDAATISRMLGHFQTILEAIVANPQQQLKELPLLTAAERHQLLVEWNDTFAEYSFDKCVHQLFEAQVERTPDAVAVVFEDQQLTYRELNAQANRLAWFLVEQGVGPDTTVALLVERSIDFLSAMMAVFKAGGAYLPLDPHHPAQRLCQVLQQSQTPLVLAASKFDSVVSQALGGLPSGKRPQVLLIEELLEEQQSEENLPVCCTPSNLAYVIYTSGSTGVPKGAMVEHRGMLNHLYAKILELKLTDADTVAQTARQSFDISVWQFLAALLVGGRVHIFNDEAAADPTQLLEQVQRQGISILEIVPSLLRMMLEQITLSGANRPNLSALRWLLLTGETLPPQLCRQWLEYYPGIPMLNAYGPTECSDDVTHYPIYQPPAPEVLNIPIGRPVANTQLYVLDSQLQPVPIGVSGELYVGGMGVGRGYLNNAERTSEVFIADIFAQKPGARLYKTGDKARYLSDGNIEFLGRLDHQVKIRAFRIELGEIEAMLAQHPEVRETIVIAWEDQPDDKRLVAYVVPNQEVETQHFLSLLRRFLKEKLPDYMIPSAFVMLEALPLTPNGKVDRHALPAPDKSSFTKEVSFVLPRYSLELQLATIWEEVLDVHPLGVQNNFFELGGHSLLAVQLMAQIHQQFGKNLPLATLLQYPTIEEMASILSQQTDSLPWSPLVAIQLEGSKPPFFCVPGGAADVIQLHHLARHLGSDQPFYGLQPQGLDGKLEPHTRVEDMAVCYIEALQTVQSEGPYFLGGHSFGGYVAFEMAQQLQKQGHEVALLAIMDEVALVPSIKKPVDVDEDDAKELTYLVRLMERFFDKKVELLDDALHTLDPDKQLNYIAERLKIANLLPPQVGTEQLRGFLKVSKAVSQAFDFYVPRNVYPTKITFFRANEDNPEDYEDFSGISELSEILKDPALGWGQFSAERVEIHIVPGDHVTMMTEPHVQVLAEQLRACLDRAQADD